jgi:hypothetical protein
MSASESTRHESARSGARTGFLAIRVDETKGGAGCDRGGCGRVGGRVGGADEGVDVGAELIVFALELLDAAIAGFEGADEFGDGGHG